MAVSIPPSMTFELLSRLPPQSFVVEDRQFQVDVPQAQYDLMGINGVPGVDAQKRLRFHVRGSPNEFMLNTDLTVSGTAAIVVDYKGNTYPTQEQSPHGSQQSVARAAVVAGPSLFQSSRESFNSGALPLLENQDSHRHHVFNSLRSFSARRDVKADGAAVTKQAGTGSARYLGPGSFGAQSNLHVDGLEGAGWKSLADRSAGIYHRNVVLTAAGLPLVDVGADCETLHEFAYPLGYYSALVNSASVLPIGLMSSYSINGFAVELQFEDPKMFVYRPYFTSTAGNAVPTVDYCSIRGLQINAKIVKILDPAVMNSVLALYEKRESIAVGGVQFPLSLRLNTINYRSYNFPITAGQQKLYFRLPTTDKSVRGIAWMIAHDKNYFGNDLTLANAAANDDVTKGTGRGLYPWATDPISVTRVMIKAGSAKLMDGPVQSDNQWDSRVANWACDQASKVAAQFSPLPSYAENDAKGHAENYLRDVYNQNPNDNRYGTVSGAPQECRHTVAAGWFSCQNMDYRESDYSGSFEASGIDMTNVGGYDIEIDVGAPTDNLGFVSGAGAAQTGPNAWEIPTAFGYQIYFLVAYDTILESSPSGVSDITNAVL